LIVEYDDHGTGKIAVVDLSGKVQDLAADLGGGDVTRPYTAGSLSVAGNGRFAYTRADPAAPPALATGTSARDIVTLVDPGRNAVRGLALGPVEEVDFPSKADGRRVQGWLIKPPDFDPAGKYPLLLEIHGGPFASYGPSFAAEHQLYAAAGYVVLYLNPRGSTSYGEEFANLIHHDYPDQDFDDLMSGVDAVAARGYVDTKRLFVTGGSGGGVLSAWIVGHTDRFRAAISERAVNAIDSFAGSSDIGWGFGDDLYGPDPERQRLQSPLTYADRIRTPLLIIHSEQDWRCPLEQAQRLYVALRNRDAEVELLMFPGEGHELSRSGLPSHRVARFDAILDWFGRYLK
jgi:acylaminoacyl-peptidase